MFINLATLDCFIHMNICFMTLFRLKWSSLVDHSKTEQICPAFKKQKENSQPFDIQTQICPDKEGFWLLGVRLSDVHCSWATMVISFVIN
jgi:hypothetical protein